MQLTTEVEIHGRSSSDPLLKGYYPTHKKLNEEIHSQVKIYEKMTDVQRVALQLQQKRSDTDKHLVAAAMQKLQADEKTTSRYTSTSKLIPGAPAPNTNQLDKSSNYASYSPSWYAADNQEDNSNVYNNQYPSATSWQPNIAVSCSSNTDNYSSVESSQVWSLDHLQTADNLSICKQRTNFLKLFLESKTTAHKEQTACTTLLFY